MRIFGGRRIPAITALSLLAAASQSLAQGPNAPAPRQSAQGSAAASAPAPIIPPAPPGNTPAAQPAESPSTQPAPAPPGQTTSGQTTSGQTTSGQAAPAQPAPQPPPAPSGPQAGGAAPPGSLPASPAAEAPAPSPVPQRADGPFADVFAQLAGRVASVVVNISTQATVPPPKPGEQQPQPNTPGTTLDEMFRDFFTDRGNPGATPGPRVASLGSGFIIDPSGLIVTNNHVIATADQITVTLSDDTALQAQVIGRDAVTDLALLKVQPKGPLPAASWGDSGKVRVGDWVLAIGNPFGLGGTVTAGIISATARDIHSGPYDDYLQTDASINRGNSGGPTFNLNGEVVGINTVIYSPSGGSIGIGFAIPSALAQPIIEQLKATGKVERGWIGARIQPLTDELAESVGLDKSRGAMIAAVDAGSPAAQAKLQPGDVILSYDGLTIDRSRQLPRLVADTPPEKVVKLTVWRDSKEYDVELKAAALDPNRPAPAPPAPEKPKPPATVDAFGLKLARPTADVRKQFSLPDSVKGAVITEVPQNSAGSAQGLRPGDLIIGVGHAAVSTPEEVPPLAASARKAGQKRALIRIEREGTTRFVALPLEAG